MGRAVDNPEGGRSMSEQPLRPPSHDRIYPRCVWCGVELYALGVIAYSLGDAACGCCGRKLPATHVRPKEA